MLTFNMRLDLTARIGKPLGTDDYSPPFETPGSIPLTFHGRLGAFMQCDENSRAALEYAHRPMQICDFYSGSHSWNWNSSKN